MLSRRVLAFRFTPVFQSPSDMALALNSYGSDDFSVDVFSSHDGRVDGEVRFRGRTSELAAELTEGIPSNAVVAQTIRDLSTDAECRAQITSDGIAFSYRHGVFEFSKTVSCDEASVATAEAILVEHLIGFLRTLGTFLDWPTIERI